MLVNVQSVKSKTGVRAIEVMDANLSLCRCGRNEEYGENNSSCCDKY